MDINVFIANFAAQMEEIDPSLVTAQTNFHEIDEWSSLSALTIIAMVDDEYGVKITGDEIRNSQTVEDIFNIVKAKKNV